MPLQFVPCNMRKWLPVVIITLLGCDPATHLSLVNHSKHHTITVITEPPLPYELPYPMHDSRLFVDTANGRGNYLIPAKSAKGDNRMDVYFQFPAIQVKSNLARNSIRNSLTITYLEIRTPYDTIALEGKDAIMQYFQNGKVTTYGMNVEYRDSVVMIRVTEAINK